MIGQHVFLGFFIYEIVQLSPVNTCGRMTYTPYQNMSITLLGMHRHTFFCFALLLCTPQLLYLLQPEGKTLHQRNNYDLLY